MSLRNQLLSTCLLGCLLAPTALVAQSWPSFGGPAFNGSTTAELPQGEGELSLRVRYKKELGVGYSSVSVDGGIAVTSFGKGERDYVAAFEAESGRELWRYDLAPLFDGKDGVHDGPASTPAISDGRVFALDPSGVFVGLDAKTGELLWRKDLIEEFGLQPGWYGCTSPLVVDDTVVVQLGGDAGVVALDPVTGLRRWSTPLRSGGCSSPVLARIDGEHSLLILGASELAVLRPADGSVLMKLEGLEQLSANASPLPIALQEDGEIDAVFVRLQHGQSRILAIGRGPNGFTADPVHDMCLLGRTYAPPTLWDKVIYGYTSRFLSAVDPASGKQLWRSRAPGDGWNLMVDGRVVAITKEGTLHTGVADRTGFTESDRLELFEDLVWTPPSFANGSVFLRSLGELARVDLVRRSVTQEQGSGPQLPTVLAELQEQIEGGRDASEAVERFLAGKELPLINGERVLFLWHGKADDVGIAGEMIGLRSEEAMHRLDGTDLWWWETELDPNARSAYNFIVDFEPITDPKNPRSDLSAIVGPDMQWVLLETGDFLERSWFSMPERPADPDYLESPPSDRPRGTLRTHEPIKMEPGGGREPVPVPVSVWTPPGYDPSHEPYPVAFVHGAFATTAGRWPTALDNLVGSGKVRPLIVVFLAPPYFLGAVYNKEFGEEVLPLIEARYHITKNRSQRALIGMGNETLFAGPLIFLRLEQFGLLGLQSVVISEPTELSYILDPLARLDSQQHPLRIYHDWGAWDVFSPSDGFDKREIGKRLHAAFETQDLSLAGGQILDSTDWWSWRTRIDKLLLHLFPPD